MRNWFMPVMKIIYRNISVGYSSIVELRFMMAWISGIIKRNYSLICNFVNLLVSRWRIFSMEILGCSLL